MACLWKLMLLVACVMIASVTADGEEAVKEEAVCKCDIWTPFH